MWYRHSHNKAELKKGWCDGLENGSFPSADIQGRGGRLPQPAMYHQKCAACTTTSRCILCSVSHVVPPEWLASSSFIHLACRKHKIPLSGVYYICVWRLTRTQAALPQDRVGLHRGWLPSPPVRVMIMWRVLGSSLAHGAVNRLVIKRCGDPSGSYC